MVKPVIVTLELVMSIQLLRTTLPDVFRPSMTAPLPLIVSGLLTVTLSR